MSAAGWLIGLGGAAVGLVLLERKARASSQSAGARSESAELSQLAPVVLDDAAALGRVIRSEVGDGSDAERASVAWAVRNHAALRRTTVAKLVCAPCGHEAGFKRPFSSFWAAKPADVRLATIVLAAPQTSDPTGGANDIIEPALQDRLIGHDPRYKLTYAQVRERWIGQGARPMGRVGRLELWQWTHV